MDWKYLISRAKAYKNPNESMDAVSISEVLTGTKKEPPHLVAPFL
jgi:hypothetical protein